jgi:hypothetical protein
MTGVSFGACRKAAWQGLNCDRSVLATLLLTYFAVVDMRMTI